jgi:hypothetical protein
MASILFFGDFLAGSLLTILLPIGLLIALTIWGVRAIRRVPDDPAEAVPPAAGQAEAPGQADGSQPAAKVTSA